jgi:uncharacterized DUF497 family protein
LTEAPRFEWDAAKAAGNRQKHGVSFEEPTTVFGDTLGRITDDLRHSAAEERFVLLGQSDRPRLLVAMFTERDEVIRLISARTATAASEGTMKKSRARKAGGAGAPPDEVLPEYDFSTSRPNKYASRYRRPGLGRNPRR